MVLLILVAIWAAFLLPPYLRNRAEARPADSIGAFRRQLATLQRTRPRIGGFVPGVSAVGAGAMGGVPETFLTPMAASVTEAAAAPSAAAAGAAAAGAAAAGVAAAGVAAPGGVAARQQGHRPRPQLSARARAPKRRRDVFVFLLVAMGVSLLLGVFFPVMFAVHAFVDVIFAVYLALLIRMRNLAAEREMKVRFLPSPVSPFDSAAALLRRSMS